MLRGCSADIGILALAQFFPEVYLPVFGQQIHGPELVDAERAAFGFDHAELGACLLEVWQFPTFLSEAIAAHHDKEEAEKVAVVGLIFAGNLMPDAIWLAQTSAFQAAFACFEHFFHFKMPQFIELALEVNQAVAREAELFQIGGLHAVDGETLEIIKEGYGLTASRR